MNCQMLNVSHSVKASPTDAGGCTAVMASPLSSAKLVELDKLPSDFEAGRFPGPSLLDASLSSDDSEGPEDPGSFSALSLAAACKGSLALDVSGSLIWLEVGFLAALSLDTALPPTTVGIPERDACCLPGGWEGSTYRKLSGAPATRSHLGAHLVITPAVNENVHSLPVTSTSRVLHVACIASQDLYVKRDAIPCARRKDLHSISSLFVA